VIFKEYGTQNKYSWMEYGNEEDLYSKNLGIHSNVLGYAEPADQSIYFEQFQGVILSWRFDLTSKIMEGI